MNTILRAAWGTALLLPALASAMTPAATAPVGPEVGAMALRVVLSLAGVVALALALAWMVRRLQLGVGHGQRRLRILESLPVGAKERVVLIALGDRQLLLGVAPGSVRTLQTLEAPIPEPTPVASVGFAQVLANLRRSGGKP